MTSILIFKPLGINETLIDRSKKMGHMEKIFPNDFDNSQQKQTGQKVVSFQQHLERWEGKSENIEQKEKFKNIREKDENLSLPFEKKDKISSQAPEE